MSISARIQQSEFCSYIELMEDEKEIYRGAGLKIARFENQKLVELFDPMNVPWKKNRKAMINNALENAVRWLESANGEVWLVMCSCFELCEPRRLTIHDASYAHMARVIGEDFRRDI